MPPGAGTPRCSTKFSAPMSDKVGASARGRAFVGVRGQGRGHAEGDAHADAAGHAKDKDGDEDKGTKKGKGHADGKGHTDGKGRAVGAAHASDQARERGSARAALHGKVPTQEELQHPIDAPKEPPENVFGYEKPVKGCFEGTVFFLEPKTKSLPSGYDALDAATVLYACEWDIPARDWKQGFPGIPERFEWFAIRYAGSFAVKDAGKYGFRLASDDGSKLTIDGKLVIDNDGEHPPKTKTTTVELTAGDHDMVLEYFQGPRFLINLQLYVTPPKGSEGLFSVR